jgi:hypothetical protein
VSIVDYFLFTVDCFIYTVACFVRVNDSFFVLLACFAASVYKNTRENIGYEKILDCFSRAATVYLYFVAKCERADPLVFGAVCPKNGQYVFFHAEGDIDHTGMIGIKNRVSGCQGIGLRGGGLRNDLVGVLKFLNVVL